MRGKSKTFTYTGHDNLEAMTMAVKYNKYLTGLIVGQLGKGDVSQKRILDFGAGSGTYADMLRKQGYRVDCVEPDTKLQKVLKAKGYKVASYIDDVQADTYDVIYSLNVMEHIEDDHEAFDKITGALKKEGVAVIYVPAFQSIYSSMDELVGHYRRYRKDRLREMAARNNLVVRKLEYVDALGYLASLAYKMSGNKQGAISPRSVKLYDSVAFPISHKLGFFTKHFVGKNAVLIAEKNNSEVPVAQEA